MQLQYRTSTRGDTVLIVDAANDVIAYWEVNAGVLRAFMATLQDERSVYDWQDGKPAGMLSPSDFGREVGPDSDDFRWRREFYLG